MPITSIRFESGIFSCREVGTIDADDARLWADRAALYAASSQQPIVALIDATRADYITAEARSIFARATAIPNLHNIAFATNNFTVMQNARLIEMMAVDKHTHFFNSLADARRFARQRADLLMANQNDNARIK